jgi:hypothetical protein
VWAVGKWKGINRGSSSRTRAEERKKKLLWKEQGILRQRGVLIGHSPCPKKGSEHGINSLVENYITRNSTKETSYLN